MLARVPWVKTNIKIKSKPRKINADRKRRMVAETAVILKTGEPTYFAFEASCRHGLRRAFCEDGWKWEQADRAAQEIVSIALHIIGAVRPTWQQGQPEWTEPGALPIERTNCKRCRKPLPDGHRLFCSHLCNTAFNGEKRRKRLREEINAQWRAAHIARAEKRPDRNCEWCGTAFKPKKPNQRFCCQSCVRLQSQCD